MNCFQNCIFTYDSQLILFNFEYKGCCELLSELYFYLWFPTTRILSISIILLWIAFRIVFLLMIPNKAWRVIVSKIVVNCFQNCIFTYDSQQKVYKLNVPIGCELLSELYFYLWFPTLNNEFTFTPTLWIAFRIVFLLMIPNKLKNLYLFQNVVNCFQNCIFTYDSQQECIITLSPFCCELLSELYFYLWFPTPALIQCF